MAGAQMERRLRAPHSARLCVISRAQATVARPAASISSCQKVWKQSLSWRYTWKTPQPPVTPVRYPSRLTMICNTRISCCSVGSLQSTVQTASSPGAAMAAACSKQSRTCIPTHARKCQSGCRLAVEGSRQGQHVKQAASPPQPGLLGTSFGCRKRLQEALMASEGSGRGAPGLVPEVSDGRSGAARASVMRKPVQVTARGNTAARPSTGRGPSAPTSCPAHAAATMLPTAWPYAARCPPSECMIDSKP